MLEKGFNKTLEIDFKTRKYKLIKYKSRYSRKKLAKKEGGSLKRALKLVNP